MRVALPVGQQTQRRFSDGGFRLSPICKKLHLRTSVCAVPTDVVRDNFLNRHGSYLGCNAVLKLQA
jgi:hypothetical protein